MFDNGVRVSFRRSPEGRANYAVEPSDSSHLSQWTSNCWKAVDIHGNRVLIFPYSFLVLTQDLATTEFLLHQGGLETTWHCGKFVSSDNALY